jgi:hypothetical protein
MYFCLRRRFRDKAATTAVASSGTPGVSPTKTHLSEKDAVIGGAYGSEAGKSPRTPPHSATRLLGGATAMGSGSRVSHESRSRPGSSASNEGRNLVGSYKDQYSEGHISPCVFSNTPLPDVID